MKSKLEMIEFLKKRYPSLYIYFMTRLGKHEKVENYMEECLWYIKGDTKNYWGDFKA